MSSVEDFKAKMKELEGKFLISDKVTKRIISLIKNNLNYYMV